MGETNTDIRILSALTFDENNAFYIFKARAVDENFKYGWYLGSDGFNQGRLQTYGDYFFVPESAMTSSSGIVTVHSTDNSTICSGISFSSTTRGGGDDDDYDFMTARIVSKEGGKVKIELTLHRVGEYYENYVQYYCRNKNVKTDDYTIDILYDDDNGYYDFVNTYIFDISNVQETENCAVNFYAIDEQNIIHNILINLTEGEVERPDYTLRFLLEETSDINFKYDYSLTDGQRMYSGTVGSLTSKEVYNIKEGSYTINVRYNPSEGYGFYIPKGQSNSKTYSFPSTSGELPTSAYTVVKRSTYEPSASTIVFSSNTVNRVIDYRLKPPRKIRSQERVTGNTANAYSVTMMPKDTDKWVKYIRETGKFIVLENEYKTARTGTITLLAYNFSPTIFDLQYTLPLSSFSRTMSITIEQKGSDSPDATTKYYMNNVKLKNSTGKDIGAYNIGIYKGGTKIGSLVGHEIKNGVTADVSVSVNPRYIGDSGITCYIGPNEYVYEKENEEPIEVDGGGVIDDTSVGHSEGGIVKPTIIERGELKPMQISMDVLFAYSNPNGLVIDKDVTQTITMTLNTRL